MAFRYNVLTGELDLVGGSSTPPVSTTEYNVNKFTLSAGQIAAKQVTLTDTPTTANITRLIVIGGLEQDQSVDFSISGNVVSWNGLGLDGVLAENDKIIVIFN